MFYVQFLEMYWFLSDLVFRFSFWRNLYIFTSFFLLDQIPLKVSGAVVWLYFFVKYLFLKLVHSSFFFFWTDLTRLTFTYSKSTSIEIKGWLLLTFSICLHNQLSSFNSIIVQISEKRDSSNSKNEWLLISVTFTAKFEWVFVLTFENAFS